MHLQQTNLQRAETLVSLLVPMAGMLYENLQFLLNELLVDAESLGPVPSGRLHRRGEAAFEVRKVIDRIRTGITAPLVAGELGKSGFRLDTRRPAGNVGNILRRMVAEGILSEVEAGSGRRPARYKLAEAIKV